MLEKSMLQAVSEETLIPDIKISSEIGKTRVPTETPSINFSAAPPPKTIYVV